MKPIDVKTMDDIAKLKSDHFSVGEWGIFLSDDSVTINNVEIPSNAFRALVNWYIHEQ